MTPFDHANTVREALTPIDSEELSAGLAALDALQTQAETAEKREWEYHELWHAETDRAEAAEAERDHARDALRRLVEWNDKWPSHRVYGSEDIKRVAAEIDEIVAIARAALGDKPPAADPDLVRHWNPS